MAQQIQIRRDTSSNWSSVNPTLAQGELGLETNSNKVKIGDGTTAWNTLSYFGGAGALASLSDVNVNSLASGQVLIANASNIFINQSLATLVNKYVSFQSLGSLAVLNNLSYYALDSRLSLGSLAVQNNLSYFALDSRLSLGSLAVLNSLTKTDVGLGNVTNDAQLKIASNLSDLNNVTTARGNLSLGSLAVLNSVVAVVPSTASFDAIYSNNIINLSTITTSIINAANGRFSGIINDFDIRTDTLVASTVTVNSLLANIGSFNSLISARNLFTQGIVNTSTISTNLLDARSAVFASQVSIQNLNGNSLYFNSGIIGGLDVTTETVGGLLTTNGGIVNTSTISTNLIYARAGVFASSVSTRALTVVVDINAPNVDTVRAFYGTGVDGAVSLDSNTIASYNYPFATASTNGTYILTRDVHATTFSLGAINTLITAGYRIFATEYILLDGSVQNNGGNASGTTAGTGAMGGFFRAGTAGAAGLGTGSAGAVGTVPTSPASGTVVGQPGGRGASARSGANSFSGTNIAFANYTPTNPNIGSMLETDLTTYFQAFIPSGTAANTQLTYSLGGGSGAKSTTGTSASSGGGGGGGGVVFLSSPSITTTQVNATGGNGGNAAGTGGIFGGGGGGAGGIIAYITRKTAPDISTYPKGGAGGSSAGNANTLAVTKADNTFSSTATLQVFSFTPTQVFSVTTQYLLAFFYTGNAGSLANVASVYGLGCNWNYVQDVYFSTIANPTRRLMLYEGSPATNDYNVLKDTRIKIEFDAPVNSVRAIVDEIQNTSRHEGNSPIGNTAIFSSDSSAVPLTNLGFTPTTNNTQYSVIARAGGTSLTAGPGCLLINNQTTAPLLASMVATSRITSNASYTTAGAVAMITLDLSQPTVQEDGEEGYDGKVIRFNV